MGDKGFKSLGLTIEDNPLLRDRVKVDYERINANREAYERLRMREEMKSDDERRSPDTYHCDCLFVRSFVDGFMCEELDMIARDYLKHEFGKLDMDRFVWYINDDNFKKDPETSFSDYIMNLMMNSLKQGSQYTADLLLYLHKTFYRKEYQQLKRFKTLSAEEIKSLANFRNDWDFMISLARILTISRLYGIEFKGNISFIYSLIDDFMEKSNKEEDWSFMDSVDEICNSCIDEVPSHFESEREKMKLQDKADKFVRNVFLSEGMDSEYADICDRFPLAADSTLGNALAILRKTYKDREYSKEELTLYSVIFRLAHILIENNCYVDSTLKRLLHGNCDPDYEAIGDLFKPEDVGKNRSAGLPESRSAAKTGKDGKCTISIGATGTAPNGNDNSFGQVAVGALGNVPAGTYKEETLLKEIEELRMKLHQQESEIKHLRSEMIDRQKLEAENNRLKEYSESEKKELVALRDYVYNLTERPEAEDAVSVDEMKKYIRNLRIIIIGGNDKWVIKMKQEFPGWTYVNATVSGTMETSIVEKADKVYFFTDTISHSTYFRYSNVVKERNVPFGYIHGVNIENVTKQLYRELKE